MTLEDAEKLIAERSGWVIFDPSCKQCVAISYAEVWDRMRRGEGLPDGFVETGDRAGAVRPCESCKTRTPLAWLRDVPPHAVADFFNAHPNDAFAFDDFRVALSKRAGKT